MPPEDTTYRHELYRWEVICLDLRSGKELWKQVAHTGNPRTGSNPGNGYAAETPATDGQRVYAWFGMTGIFCYDNTGELQWARDLGAFKTLNSWGTGSSPVVYNGMLFVQVDNEEKSFIIALDGATGQERWRVQRDEKTNYSTPFIWKNKGRTELVAGGKTVRSYEPSSGKLLWQCKIGGGFSIPSPSASEELLIIGNAGGPDKPGNLFAIKAGAEGDISLADTMSSANEWIAWSLPAAGTGNPSPLLYKGLIYIISSNGGNVICFDAATGKTVYTEKIEKTAGCWTSPWAYDNKVYFTDERGTTYIVRAGEKFELLARNRIKDKFWASPAISSNAYVFKGVKKIYCLSKN
jgi:outer membrane protein assembly factor BamB